MGLSRSVGIVTAINIVGALLSVANVSVIAYLFGTSTQIEVFFAATLLLNALANIANNGQLFDILMPIYHRVSAQESRVQGLVVYSVLVNWLFVFSSLLLVIVYFNLSSIIALIVSGFEPAAQFQVVDIARVVLPLMLLMLCCSFINTYLNAEKKFGRVEIIGIVSRLVNLGVLLFFYESQGIWALVIALWLELSIRFLCLLILALKSGYRHSFVFKSKHLRFGDIFQQGFLAFAFVISGKIMVLVLSAGLSQLPQGVFAIYNYTSRLYERTNRIFLRPISLVFFTSASRIFTGSEVGDIKKLVHKSLGIFMLVTVPVILYMFFWGKETLQVVLGSREITPEQLGVGGQFIAMFFSIMLLGGLGNIYRRLLVAGERAKQFYLLGSISQCLSIFLFWYFLLQREAQVSDVILVHVVSSSLYVAVMFLLARVNFGFYVFYPVEKLFQWSSICLILSFVLYTLLNYVTPLVQGLQLAGRIEAGAIIVVCMPLYIFLLYLFGRLFRVSEVDQVLTFVKSKFSALVR